MSEPNASPLAVGIDLGTTYSAIAWLDDAGFPQTLVNGEGDKLTPSAVLFEDDQVIVGKEAIKALATEAEDVALFAKRMLGARLFSHPLAGREYPPEAIQAWILQKLKADGARQIGPIDRAVITVPAYFDEVRRKATQDAGYIAGLDVLDIINEPTAAAIAYGFREGIAADAGNLNGFTEPIRVLVYDLGGGTFDVTVLEIAGAHFVALATDGDVQLGGNDWDDRLVDYVAEKFIARHGKDPRQDANTLGRLWRECEDAKRTLSARQKTAIACDYRGLAIREEVTRQLFEELTADLLERTAFTTKETLLASGLAWGDIDRVLLVGGSTRMPAVRAMLREIAGKEPDCSISPDEAVAHGAALRAGYLLKTGGYVDKLSIKNVNSHSLGVVGTESGTRRERSAILIPRNTPLPVTAKRVFKTQKANQRSILIPVVEGESAAAGECVPIGEVVVSHLPAGLPPHTPIEVRFTYEGNGRLQVNVAVEGSDQMIEHVLHRPNSMDVEELNRWRVYVSGQPAAH